MNKFSLIFLAILAAVVMLAGCSSDDKSGSASESSSKSPASEASVEASSVSETEPVTLPHDITPAEGTYIYDNAGVMDEAAFSECNDYAEWLYENYLINTAVVTIDDLGGLSAEEYAANAYQEIYGGAGSGLLLLVNNDTNKDILYKTGRCLTSIDENAEKQALYWATQDIVSGDYKSAVLRLMQLGELCPQYVFDNAGVFTTEQVGALEEMCKNSASSYIVFATANSTDKTDEEIGQSYYSRYKDGEFSGYMIMIDIASKSAFLIEDGTATSNGSLIKANELATAGDYYNAVLTLMT